VSGFGSQTGADLGGGVTAGLPATCPGPGRWSEGTARSLTECGVPAFLQNSLEADAHGRADVRVDASHAGDLVAHALGPQQVRDARFLQPRLVTVTQAVRRLHRGINLEMWGSDPSTNKVAVSLKSYTFASAQPLYASYGTSWMSVDPSSSARPQQVKSGRSA
jgi:hypothetical protein